MTTATVPAPTTPAFMRIPELASHLGVSPRSVRRLMNSHRIPFVRLGGVALFRRSDVDEAIEHATVPAVWQESRKTRRAAK